MTNCTEINELLSMYIDGQLGENEKKQFEEHIAGCEACKREYEEILSIVRLCEGIEEEELPPDFGQKLHARLIEANGNNLEEASAIESISEVPDESISESISGSKSESSSESSSESKAGKIIMMFRNTYFRVGASVAAALLLVFLVRGIYSPGVLTNTTGSLSISANESAMDKASEARQESAAAMTAPAAGNSGGEAASAADMPADGNTNSTTVYGSSGDNQSEEGMGGGSAPQAKMAEVPSVSAYVMNDQASGVSGEDASSNDAAAGTKAAVQPVETDRAAADARLQQPMLAAMLAPETATSTEASVDIVTADKKAAIEQIKAIAIKYEGAETTAPVS
ncbi:MAG: zf-HC2 domain-containing protein, partial [Clostridiales bacterium]|nr:zf-HC2 domain-containing protein [Clostridiales bacterium]